MKLQGLADQISNCLGRPKPFQRSVAWSLHGPREIYDRFTKPHAIDRKATTAPQAATLKVITHGNVIAEKGGDIDGTVTAAAGEPGGVARSLADKAVPILLGLRLRSSVYSD